MHTQNTTGLAPEILIVDDQPEHLWLLAEILRHADYRVRMLRDGSTTVSSALNSPPDLILLDIMMPNMNGYEVCRQLKADEGTRDIPVLFISALGDVDSKVNGFTVGGVDYVSKPFQKEEVVARVNTHLALSRLRTHLEEIVAERTAALQQEIAEREQVEQALRKSEFNLAQAQQIANLGSWEYDRTTGMLTLSREFCRMFGVEPQEAPLAYSSVFEMIPPEDRQSVMAAYEAAIQNHVPYDSVHRIIRQSDGAVRYVQDKCEFITDDAGKIVRSVGITHDITEHKQAEMRLEQKALRYNTLLKAYSDGVVIINQDGQVMEANRRFAEVLGYTPEEVLTLHIWDWDTTMTEAKFRASIGNFPEDGLLFESRSRRKDGSLFDVEVSVCEAKVGDEILSLAISRDITERKRMERSLKKERMRYKALLEAYHDGIVIINQDCQIVEANRSFAEMRGYTPEEVFTLHIWDWDATMTEAEIRANFGSFHKAGLTFETRHRRKDGTLFDVEVRACETKVGDEMLSLSICRDITERKQMERVLGKEMQQRKTLMAGYRDGIVIINSSQDHKVVEANRRFAEMLGYTPEEVLGLHTWDWEAVMTGAEIRANSQNSTPPNNMFETRHRRKDGTMFDVEVSAYGEMVDGEVLILCICRDITERKRVEEELQQYREGLEELVQERTAELTLANQQLQQEIAERKRVEQELRQAKKAAEEAQQMAEAAQRASLEAQRAAEAAQRTAEDANRAKTEFLANMSHEIRTPLNAVLGFAELLGQRLTDPQHHYYLTSIKTGGHNLLSLMNDILDLAKIESGRLEIRSEPVNLRELAKEAAYMFHADIAKKELNLQLDIAPDIPRSLLLDGLRLRQVLFNLLGNAVKFTERGKIELRIANCELRIDQSQIFQPVSGRAEIPKSEIRNLKFEIIDTGIGIPKDQQQVIFDAFRQQDGQRTRKYGGTGLGLTITKRLVDMMGGTLTLTSEVGEGSRFEIVLPQIPKTDEKPGRTCPPELLEWLDECQELWDIARRSSDFDDIEAFGTHLKTLGERYSVKDLHAFGERLIAVVHSFDAEHIQSVLASYPDVAKSVKGELEQIFPQQKANSEKQPAGGALAALPDDQLVELEQAAVQGDVEAMENAVRNIRNHDPVLAETLQALADEFDYGKIVKFIQQSRSE